MTASVSFGLTWIAPLLANFLESYPDLRLELSFTDAVVDLAAERIDVAIRHGPLADSSLIARKLLPVVYCLCASPAYLSRHGVPATPADLSQHRCLGFATATTRPRWRFLKKTNGEEITTHPSIAINNGIALERCALDGGGLVLLSNWLVEEALRSGALVPLLPDYDATPTELETALWLVYPSRAYVPRKVEVFVDFLEEVLRARRRSASS